jgi:DNA repair photolyase
VSFKIIYEPKGRAKEYGDLALNIYTGCSFGCTYCFAPLVLKKDRDTFHKLSQARDNLLDKVKKDCENNQFEGRRVHLCFTCDPYQDIDLELQLTREVLKLFKQYNVNFQILTKGGMRAARDFDLYKDGDSFGSTLTFSDTDKSLEWEPRAAEPLSRIEAIVTAHERGIKTWVSLEPVISPQDTVNYVTELHNHVDLWKVGRWNYDQRAKDIDWKRFGRTIKNVFNILKCEYYIKEDLRKEMER